MASAAPRWSRAAINRDWAKRSLRVLVEPTPITFAERRSVLQVLQQRGPIEVFTRVPDYPSQFIAVTAAEKTADDLRGAGLLSYTVAAPAKIPDIRFVDLSRPEILDGTKATIRTGSAPPETDEQGHAHKEFRLRVVDLEGYDHANTMSSSPLNRAWPKSYTHHETFISSVLKQSLPHNMAAKGLARWDYNTEDKGEVSRKKDRLQLWKWMPNNMKKPKPGEPE